MGCVKAGVHWFAEDGWVIDFFVQPREDFPEKGQPMADWCEARGIRLIETVPNWEGRCELIAVGVPVDLAMEFKMRWC